MSKAPLLVLQMQRMGDLVLSCPAVRLLQRSFPGHPVWVVAERMFSAPLQPLTPGITYFDASKLDQLRQHQFHIVLNLSHRPEAALLAGSLHSDALFGPYMKDAGGQALHIQGAWQLYRAGLTGNNRYNLFHWADLNALDMVSLAAVKNSVWSAPRALAASAKGHSPRIGLFLGASEPEKHPNASFWAELTKLLRAKGAKPVLLGGPAEQPLGRAVAAQVGDVTNMCGRFSLAELVAFIAELDLFITPDTGPMHLAVWAQTPVLNLSMGPVHAWETGPFFPGHHVLRANLDCTGCWNACPPLTCHKHIAPPRVIAAVEAILQGNSQQKDDAAAAFQRTGLATRLAGLELLESGRGKEGLYTLTTLCTGRALPGQQHSTRNGNEAETTGLLAFAEPGVPQARQLLANFWQQWFISTLGHAPAIPLEHTAAALAQQHPELAKALQGAARALALFTVRLPAEPKDFSHKFSEQWQETPQLVHPLAGYAQMFLQNANGSLAARGTVLQWVERLTSLLEKR
ncbi:glycosyltransferase family 9 protein [Desulfovibrio cuneatus]|uniref:glycosyltransferase family 9 protein n=1 Tax=Desulfovibrio cuneatus TaxID=159728 RepID=UPI000413A16B|nr:glycosyltransferase family 9 protein [Desulfovibrio cuneatus]